MHGCLSLYISLCLCAICNIYCDLCMHRYIIYYACMIHILHQKLNTGCFVRNSCLLMNTLTFILNDFNFCCVYLTFFGKSIFNRVVEKICTFKLQYSIVKLYAPFSCLKAFFNHQWDLKSFISCFKRLFSFYLEYISTKCQKYLMITFSYYLSDS